MLTTDLFDYELPEELIAQHPAERRDASRMMVLDRETGAWRDEIFSSIVNEVRAGDILVFNDTKVLRCRMYGLKDGRLDAARFELLLTDPGAESPRRWKALLKPGKRAKAGTFVALCDGRGVNAKGDGFTVLGRADEGAFEIEFNTDDVERLQREYGHIPLPPYIRRSDDEDDEERYQTVYAREPGAVAAPTAGLHFSEAVLAAMRGKGVEERSVTLHVGIGTFKPVSVANVNEHHMHSESFTLSPETAEAVNAARRRGGRILAVGTTTVRVLESCANPDGTVSPRAGRTEIFLYPPHRIRTVDMLLTNFHLPKSTLLMLVSCLIDREKLLAAYQHAVAERYRFFSYGDCMLLH